MAVTGGMKVGGFKQSLETVPSDVVEIAASLRSEIQAAVGAEFTTFDCLAYTSQVVAGTNFKIKIATGADSFVHVRIFRPLPHTGEPPELSEAKVAAEADPL